MRRGIPGIARPGETVRMVFKKVEDLGDERASFEAELPRACVFCGRMLARFEEVSTTGLITHDDVKEDEGGVAAIVFICHACEAPFNKDLAKRVVARLAKLAEHLPPEI